MAVDDEDVHRESRHRGLDPVEELASDGFTRGVDAVQAEPLRAGPKSARHAQRPHDRAASVVVDQPHRPSWRSVGADADQTTHRAQPGPHLAVAFVEDERDARHHDPFEPALQHRRQTAPPGRVHEHQAVGPLHQPGVLAGLLVDQRRFTVVRLALGGRHRDTETERVQVDHLHRVSAGPQTGDGPLGGGVGEAVVARVRDHHECLHAAASVRAGCSPIAAERSRSRGRLPMPNARVADARYLACGFQADGGGRVGSTAATGDSSASSVPRPSWSASPSRPAPFVAPTRWSLRVGRC